MINRIGVRGHDYGKNTYTDLIDKIRADGYETTQLALKKAITGVEDLDKVLNHEFCSNLGQVGVKKDFEVSVLGAYLNYVGQDENLRQDRLAILTKHMEVANLIGCRMVGTETGSLNDDYSPHGDNHGEEAYLKFKESVIGALEAADKYDTYFAVEAVSHHIIHSPKRMKRLLDEVNHPRLKVIFDISNLMTEENLGDQDLILQEAFELLEPDLLVVHVKDFTFENGKKIIVPLGQGYLKLDLLMKLVKESSQAIDVLGENVRQDKLKETYKIIKGYCTN